jgi:hypothetical protein
MPVICLILKRASQSKNKHACQDPISTITRAKLMTVQNMQPSNSSLSINRMLCLAEEVTGTMKESLKMRNKRLMMKSIERN